MMCQNMRNPPSFCQDVDCKLSADLLQLTDGGIYIGILGPASQSRFLPLWY